ncbi:hypothetical protein N7495_007643 [Penicillium taxi]|uniref:uncharacterized protein n=1 Tax=Penicillium taxi TaxID=168475 RepID=UPI0025453C2C|nr:uncharacterized protein N7495_007643 [Penicillium taxi]KAJ5887602.1 hypothetical protein N7495_007643 [Penicillium taxi]
MQISLSPQAARDEGEATSLIRASTEDPCFPQNIESKGETSLLKPMGTAMEPSVLYLAYGSNLASATFLGMRGIKPLSQISALVPGLCLTFDMLGFPYVEPCFAGTRFRGLDSEGTTLTFGNDDQDYEFISTREDLEKATMRQYTWSKPLVGVVYEVTLADYAKIIATEGGGRGYQDVLVDCYPFAEDYKPTDPVPDIPQTKVFKAHTLFSPISDEAQSTQSHKWRLNPNYGQPSSRYINLIITGAKEHDLPVSYRDYLEGIHTYHITTIRQKIGRGLFLLLWGPTLMSLMFISKLMAGPDGRCPSWLRSLTSFVVEAMWTNYHSFFKPIFGDGERTIHDPLPI